jgi:serine/threonine-protein kinase
MPTAVLSPSQVLSERYLVRRLIGLGSLAATYEAEDTTLERPVALRIYGREVVVSEEWREYFRHQVTAVASLHHPSLIRIYEWGETEDFVYLVTEFFAAGSLRDVLQARGTLSREQTAMIGLEAASALAYAHARGMVHGAIRPSKLLFDSEGRVHVADLAVAASLSGAPRPTDSLDEARYLSPEQALGADPDGRSDVYSLSLVLYQCLTGEIAHDGPTAAAARANRLAAALPHRPELGPLDLALALGAAPELDARPDAALFASRLEAVAATLPVARPVTLGPQNTGGFKVPSPDEVLLAPAVAAPARAEKEGEDLDVVRPFDLPGYRESVAAVTTSVPIRRRRSNAAAWLLASIVVLVIAIALAGAWRLGLFTPSYAVPTLVGLDYRNVAATPGAGHFTIEVASSVPSTTVAANKIIHQDPAAGASAKSGSIVRIVVSKGADLVTVPNVIGLTCATATTALQNVQLVATCPSSAQVTSQTVPAGGVAAVWYGGQKSPVQVPSGSTLALAVSTGPTGSTPNGGATTTTTTTTTPNGPRAVPNLVGLSPSAVDAAMHRAQLYYVTTGPGSANRTWTRVVSMSPTAGTPVPWHATVTVTVTNK